MKSASVSDRLDANWGSARMLSRRKLLQIGGLGLFGLNLPSLLEVEGQAASSPGSKRRSRINSCILVFYYGGPSHLDTWDMKPAAPAEIRGEFKSIATNVPGIRVCEHLPRCAQITDKLAVIRSMHHPMRNHNAAAVEALCGRTPLKGDLELLADDAVSFPCYGSALTYLLGGTPPMPAHVALPHVMYNVVVLPGQNAGFLGSSYNPMQVTRDPSAADFQVDELQLPADVPLARLENRQSLLRLVDHQVKAIEKRSLAGNTQSYYERAFRLLASDAVRRSFNMAAESPRTRDRYGRHKLGQSMLLARRLVEAGVRFVTVYDKIHNGQEANWDSHQDCFGRHRDHLLPPADQAFSALIEDLGNRGLLESTLVIAMAEFGRTPKVNKQAGRDHWPDCYSVVMSGGGVRGGQVYGASDHIGAYPDTDAVTPGDLAATLYSRFGLKPESEIRDTTGRPYRLADGEPLHRLFG